VGTYIDAGDVSHGFLLLNGSYTTIDDPLAGHAAWQGTIASGIDSSGNIVGSYMDNLGTHGFLRLSTTHAFSSIDYPGATGGTYAWGISNGLVVGSYFTANGTEYGYVYASGNGLFGQIADPHAGPLGTAAYGINSQDYVVGEYWDANQVCHAYLLNGGQYTTIDDPLGTYNDAMALMTTTGSWAITSMAVACMASCGCPTAHTPLSMNPGRQVAKNAGASIALARLSDSTRT
jgi:hypothetical protein